MEIKLAKLTEHSSKSNYQSKLYFFHHSYLLLAEVGHQVTSLTLLGEQFWNPETKTIHNYKFSGSFNTYFPTNRNRTYWLKYKTPTPSAMTGFDSKLTGVGLVPGDDTLLEVGDSEVKLVAHCCCCCCCCKAACVVAAGCCGACCWVNKTGWKQRT